MIFWNLFCKDGDLMPVTTCVLMTKTHLDRYIEMLNNRIEFLKQNNRSDYDKQELCIYVAMRRHAYNAMEFFR